MVKHSHYERQLIYAGRSSKQKAVASFILLRLCTASLVHDSSFVDGGSQEEKKAYTDAAVILLPLDVARVQCSLTHARNDL